MSELAVTLINVGWGDSIFIESRDKQGNDFYALVDSNDEGNSFSSYQFLKRHFEKKGLDANSGKPFFDFVMLSHGHSDHGQGLKKIIQTYGTKNAWYPKSASWGSMSTLLKYFGRTSNVKHHQAVDSSKIMGKLGDVALEALWPDYGCIDKKNENNNSIVLALTLDDVTFLLTGDAEEDVWKKIRSRIPGTTQCFKVPHHGSVNGTFDSNNDPVWLNHVPPGAKLCISCHIKPFTHPDAKVVQLFKQEGRDFFRTDQDYHIRFHTDGSTTTVQYFH